MAKIKIKEVSDLETVKKMIAYKLSEKLGLGTLVLDPYGPNLLFILDIAEREFGKEARKELEEFLMPYHKVRVLHTLQMEGIKQKFWLVAPSVGAKPIEDEEEDFELSTDNEIRGLEPVNRLTTNVDKDGLDPVTRGTAKVDLDQYIEEEDDDLLF
ncbi:hypothetical protein [Archaeoglobus profundus]|uniref:Uncharacterized protein n=2 Tax=root TaxID=1 RepID=D2RFD9_ARCPA|nr:hypothetical protein [Archaeoglobus profundus]ADB58833.1 hypothetical protein Arcpr_1789 [Archaeoglobus profundus DSM 5631]